MGKPSCNSYQLLIKPLALQQQSANFLMHRPAPSPLSATLQRAAPSPPSATQHPHTATSPGPVLFLLCCAVFVLWALQDVLHIEYSPIWGPGHMVVQMCCGANTPNVYSKHSNVCNDL